MQPWQEEYIGNAREVIRLRDYAGLDRFGGFEAARERADSLTRRNNGLLARFFFPALDNLHAAPPEEIAELTGFAAALLDWRENLDAGVYIALHEALLRLYRIRQDRSGIIRELYLLGMGLYYRRRMILSSESAVGAAFAFENELVFSEAASYFRYFAEIGEEETRGYIIRAMANIALCVPEPRRKIAASSRVLQVLRDPEIRALCPGLPWDRFIRSTHQQMSANRASLSRGDLTAGELSAVLDSCYEVFRPEEASKNPSARWLWPYYEMEYNCGYASLQKTLSRLHGLILATPWNQYDNAGLYGNVQLVIHYAELVSRRPELQQDGRQMAFLAEACRQMEKTLMTFPLDAFDDYFLFNLMLPFSDYAELPGLPAYRDLTLRLVMRFFGDDYVRGRAAGDAMVLICRALLRGDPAFFDDLPPEVLSGKSPAEAALALARDAGVFRNLGRIVMNTVRRPREPFDSEVRLEALHPVIGRNMLRKRASTRPLADIAFGHHAWYNGSPEGYPADYVRTESPCRQLTDAAALVTFLQEGWQGRLEPLLDQAFALAGQRFSPLVIDVLDDPEVRSGLERLLSGQNRAEYDEEIRLELSRWEVSPGKAE